MNLPVTIGVVMWGLTAQQASLLVKAGLAQSAKQQDISTQWEATLRVVPEDEFNGFIRAVKECLS